MWKNQYVSFAAVVVVLGSAIDSNAGILKDKIQQRLENG